MMDSPKIQEALNLARHHGSAQAAVDHIYSKTGGTGAVTEIEAALRCLIKRCPQDMLTVRGGTRLRNPDSRARYVMTHIGLVVDIDHGHVLAYRDMPYPLEIYRYAHSR